MDRAFWGLTVNHQDHLVVGGCDLAELAQTYGTPLHVVDEARLRLNYKSFRQAFQRFYSKSKVFYSYKTNCVPGILSILHEEECGAEVTSPYELWLALKLGYAASSIVYNGVNKSPENLRHAIEADVGLINIDSLREGQSLQAAARQLQRRVDIGIRIDPGLGWRSQFGIQPGSNDMSKVIAEIQSSDVLHLSCIHSHIGSAVREGGLFLRTIDRVTQCAADVQDKLKRRLSVIDLGGGYGIPTVKALTVVENALYKILNRPPREPDVGSCPSVEQFGQMLTTAFKDRCLRYGLGEPYLFLEPGRAITSSAQILLVTVQDIKNQTNGARFALTDGGMQNVAFPLSYEYHYCFLANRANANRTERCFVTGPLCSPQDLLYRNWKLPALQCGDVLAIMDAGAYFISFSNSFSYPKPAVVLASNGSHRLIRTRESFEEMTTVDRIAGALGDESKPQS